MKVSAVLLEMYSGELYLIRSENSAFLSLDGRIPIISSPGLLNYAALYNPELLARAGLAALFMS